MFAQTNEIKVALLGHVSVGKTTILNALFRDKYSEVSMRRTTAGINLFHVFSRPKEKRHSEASPSKSRSNSPEDWSMIAAAPRAASFTLAEIKQDNAILRETDTIQEKSFDVELDEPLCDMRKDTKLVLVDIPGVNEAGTGVKYKDWVEINWNTYDCVVVILDAIQGVNTEEQVKLLDFVKKNNVKKKDVPIVILCNKVDDPFDKEHADLVKEVREKVEQIFDVTSREEALAQVLDASHAGVRCEELDFSPIFLTLSAIHAFVYRTASRLTLEEFKKLDQDIIDKIGCEEVSKFKWNKLSDDQKYEAAYDAVSDPSLYRERLEATHFEKFLAVLSYCVGGDKVQTMLINKQIDVELGNLDSDSCTPDVLQSICNKCNAVGRSMEDFKDAFWKVHVRFTKDARAEFRRDMSTLGLQTAMAQLVTYNQLRKQFGWENSVLAESLKMFVRRQLSAIIEMEEKWELGDCNVVKFQDTLTVPNTHEVSWTGLSPHDWITILGGILLLKHNKQFCEFFGREVLVLERLLTKYHRFFQETIPDGHVCGKCSYCSGKYDEDKQCHSQPKSLQVNQETLPIGTPIHASFSSHRKSQTIIISNGPYIRDVDPRCHEVILQKAMKGKHVKGVFVPDSQFLYNLVVQVKAPESISDPDHWGNLAFQCCEALRVNSDSNGC